MIDELRNNKFRDIVWAHYEKNGRHDLPWRICQPDGGFDAYKIMVSEVMLQQTGVKRVIPKYRDFIQQFPDVLHLKRAPLGAVLTAWNGLGYNRRAKFLHLAVKEIADRYGGTIPATRHELMTLPGIGTNTAGAILAYSFNQPTVFIETNIRSVFLHHFFADQTAVPDQAVLEVVQQSVDTTRPREWYWALMDYGMYLKRTTPNPNKRSKHYSRQSPFQGSWRQLRGQVLRLLSDRPYSQVSLHAKINDERLILVLRELLSESLIQRSGSQYHL